MADNGLIKLKTGIKTMDSKVKRMIKMLRRLLPNSRMEIERDGDDYDITIIAKDEVLSIDIFANGDVRWIDFSHKTNMGNIKNPTAVIKRFKEIFKAMKTDRTEDNRWGDSVYKLFDKYKMSSNNNKIAKEILLIAKELFSSNEDDFEKFVDSIEPYLKRWKVKLVQDRFARAPVYDLKYKNKKIGMMVLNSNSILLSADPYTFSSNKHLLDKYEIRNPNKKEALEFVRILVNSLKE